MPTSVSSKKRKRSREEGLEDGGAGVTKKRRRSCHKNTTMDEGSVESQEHTRMLESVTGKIDKLSSEDYSESAKENLGTNKDSSKSDKEERNGGGEDKEDDKKMDASLAHKLAAAEYLLLWEQDRTQWAFRKKTQYWLLQNMYDKKKVGGQSNG